MSTVYTLTVGWKQRLFAALASDPGLRRADRPGSGGQAWIAPMSERAFCAAGHADNTNPAVGARGSAGLSRDRLK
jgi:hypothetical protein